MRTEPGSKLPMTATLPSARSAAKLSRSNANSDNSSLQTRCEVLAIHEKWNKIYAEMRLRLDTMSDRSAHNAIDRDLLAVEGGPAQSDTSIQYR